MFCYKCGAKLEDDAKFCRHCGTKLNIVGEDVPVHTEQTHSKPTKYQPRYAKKKSKLPLILVLTLLVVGILVVLVLPSLRKNSDPAEQIPMEEAFLQDTLATEEESVVESTETKEVVDVTEGNESAEVEGQPVNLVLLDSEDIFVEFRGIEEYSSESWIVSLYIENNRDSEIYLSLRDNRLNDYVVSLANNGLTIPAGSKYMTEPQFDLVIDVEELAEYGLSSITELDSTLHISTDMFGDTISETPVHAEFSKTIPATGIEGVKIGAGEVLLDNDDIYVEYTGISEYSSESWIVNVYVENRRDSEIYLSLRDNMVNRFSIGLSNNGITIPAKSKYLASPNFDLIIDIEDLDAYGITSIEELDFTLYIGTSMFGDCIAEKSVNVKVNKDIE